MRTDTSPTIYRKDYTPSAYWVRTFEMGFDLEPSATRVATRMTLERNRAGRDRTLTLYGDEIELVQIRLNGKVLSKNAYALKDGVLRIANTPEQVTLEIETLLHPDRNTSLMGLYV